MRNPLRWFLKVALLGGSCSTLLGLWLYGPYPGVLLRFAAVGIILATILWSGLESLWPFLSGARRGQKPVVAAIGLQIRWFLAYTLLYGAGAIPVYFLLHIQMVDMTNRAASALGFLLGWMGSSLVVGIKQTAELVEANQALAEAKAQAGFLALKAQLSPHTLFNALNTIASLIPEEPRKAEDAVERLAMLLRRILDALENERWTLAEEFALLGDLLELEKARFGPRFTVELLLDQAEAPRLIPPLLLLPLVENALKHGFRPKPGPCHLLVEARHGCIRVQDDGVGLGLAGGNPQGNGVGLRTVRERLEALGGRLAWPKTTQGCTVEITF